MPPSAQRRDRKADRRSDRKADLVARDLLEQIAHGELSPGTVLPTESELADRYAVNRSVVRESIKLLEVHRLVEPVRRRGTTVLDPFASLSPDVLRAMVSRKGRVDLAFLESLLELRASLDVLICAWAAERRKRVDLDALERQLDAMAAVADEPEAYGEASFAFGLLLARATHNPVALMLSHWNRAVVADLPHVFGVSRAAAGPHLEGLRVLVAALADKDVEKVETLVAAFHEWASPRILAAAALSNGEPLAHAPSGRAKPKPKPKKESK